ncbi:MAG: hypothetical protein KAJ19_18155 [Gammaproteobacteria bacterium]|nr:hypothetical protein [Gammaproteobacteria bacterium]
MSKDSNGFKVELREVDNGFTIHWREVFPGSEDKHSISIAATPAEVGEIITCKMAEFWKGRL